MSDSETNDKPKEVKTLLPDDEFFALRDELMHRKGRRKYERFAGDEHATKMWMTNDGRILSQMPPEDFVKEIVPSSMGMAGLQNGHANSGFAKSVQRFAELNGAPVHVAASVLIKFYGHNEIPKTIELPDEILQKFKCVQVDQQGNQKVMTADEVKENIV